MPRKPLGMSAFMAQMEKAKSIANVPGWYRGVSVFQKQAFNELLHAIRDDIDQDTTHRVHALLDTIGLVPMVRDADIYVLLRMCRGNDLAFLWFLMERHYKSSTPGHYNINEQLILSGIAHLDMITTLRELDQLLPPGHENVHDLRRREKRQKRLEAKRVSEERRSSRHQKKGRLPYFVEQKPRKIRSNINFNWRPTYYKAWLEEYKQFRNFVPENENTRWYATYQLQTTKRVTRGVLRDLVNELVTLVEIGQSDDEEREYDFSEAEKLKHINKLMNTPILCEYHKRMEEFEREERMRRCLEAQERLRKIMFKMSKKKRETLQRTHDLLERQVNIFRSAYDKRMHERRGASNFVRIYGADGSFRFVIVDGPRYECYPVEPSSTCHSATSPVLDSATYSDDETRAYVRARCGCADMQRLVGGETPRNSEGLTSALKVPGSKRRLSFEQTTESRVSHANKILAYLRDRFCFFEDCSSVNSSQRFFEAPTEHKPHLFRYEKIFRDSDAGGEREFIKNCCVEALDADVHKVPKMVDLTPDLRRVAGKYADDKWQEGTAAWCPPSESSEESAPSDPYPPDMPRMPYYDCNDKKLMNSMLQIAIEHMQKNSKFVLASLPDAHKLPYLVEFTYQRYGKRYTSEERRKEFDNGLQLLTALQQHSTIGRVPSLRDIGKKSKVKLGCEKYTRKKINYLKEQFYREVKESVMEQSRVLWFAIRGHLWEKGPPREVFFSYLPARYNDIQLIRPWKLREYRDVKTPWEKNWRKRLAEEED